MASPKVQPVNIVLNVKGADKFKALNSAFRDLSKQAKLSDADIVKATKDIADFAEKAGNSEATIKGQINALKGLQSQTSLSSGQYQLLSKDIRGLELTLNGTTEEIEAQRKAIIRNATAVGKTSGSVSTYIKQLKNLQGQTREGSKAFKDIASDVDTLSVKLDQLKAKDLQNLKVGFQGVKGAAVSAVRGAISEFSKLTVESKAAIAGVAGLGAAGAAGAALGPLGSIPAAISSSLGSGAGVLSGLKSTLGGLPLGFGGLEQIVSPEAIANLQQASQKFAGMQSELIKLDQVFDTINSTVTAFGPGATAAATAATVGIALVYDKLKKKSDEAKKDLEETFKPVGDDVQELIEKLKRLGNSLSDLSTSRINELRALARRDFDFAPAGSPLSRAAASRLAGLESVGRSEAQAQADVLEEYRQRVRGTEQSVDRLNERLSYLREGLKTVDTSTKEGALTYVKVQREIRELDGQLEKIANSYRNVADMTREAISSQIDYEAVARRGFLTRNQPGYKTPAEQRGRQFLERLESESQVLRQTLALPAAGQTTAPGTGAAVSGGAVPLRGTRGPLRPIAELPTSLGTVGGRRQRPAGVEAEIDDAARRSYISQTEAVRKNNEAKEEAKRIEQSYRAEIDKAVKANNGSINSTTRLRSAIDAYRSTLPATSQDFKNLTEQINKLDQESERLSRRMRGRRRLSAGQLAQAAGATLSGGIFGGPEGFLGGAIGTAFGGPGGAFAGAAIGAQVGGLRQQLGGFADYAAQISKLEIALKGVAGSAEDYDQALKVARRSVEELNVPQDVAIQGITRLVAAVKGAGGGINDAEIAFQNINSAIIATGGGAEEVSGAITALVQIFSKGKVSAEEINQIAERLPGTFNKIAAASGRTGPELTKALEQGQVGLNDLMKFLVQLGDDYGSIARDIADSSASAGDRLNRAFDDMRRGVGEALQPIGAKFQEAFTEFVQDITPTLIALLPKIAEFALSVAENLDVLAAAAAGAALAMGGLALASVKLTGAAGLSAIGALALRTATALGTLTVALKGSAAAALLNPWVALGAGVAALTVAIYKGVQAQRELNDLVENGAGSTKELKDKISELEAGYQKATNKLQGLNGEKKATGRAAASLKKQVVSLKEQLDKLKGNYKIRLSLESRGFTFDDEGNVKTYTVSGKVYSVRGEYLRDAEPDPSTFDTPKSKGGTTDKSAEREAEREAKQIAALKRAIAEFQSREKLLDVEAEIAEARRAQVLAQGRGDVLLSDYIDDKLIALELEKAAAQESVRYEAKEREIRETMKGQVAELSSQLNVMESMRARREAEATASDKALNNEIRKTIELEAQNRLMAQSLVDRKFELGLITKSEYNQSLLNRERERINKEFSRATPEEKDQLFDLYRQQIDPTFAEGLAQNIRKIKQELEELINPVNQITSAASAIGTAFTDSFTSVISGSATTREALAGFFKSVASYFLDMAAQIIQKMITMAILNAALGLLPGLGGGGGSSAFNLAGFGSLGSGPGSAFPLLGGSILGNAKGNAFNGGLVTKPTMFAYANGGTGNFGLMGEAGPEAIMPLRRTPSGQLGVQATGGGSTVINITNNISDGQSSSKVNGAQGGKAAADQLSKLMVAVIQKEQRPGGVLNRR